MVSTDMQQSHESIWHAWQRRNRLQEMARTARRTQLVTIGAITVLALTAVFWSHASNVQLVMRFTIALSAFYISMRAFTARAYVWATVFAGLVIVFNPLFPAFEFSGRQPSLVVLTSIGPFILLPGFAPSRSLQEASSEV